MTAPRGPSDSWTLEGELRQLGPHELREAVHAARRETEAVERERHALANRVQALQLWAESALEYLRVDERGLRDSGCAETADDLAELVAEGEAAVRGRG